MPEPIPRNRNVSSRPADIHRPLHERQPHDPPARQPLPQPLPRRQRQRPIFWTVVVLLFAASTLIWASLARRGPSAAVPAASSAGVVQGAAVSGAESTPHQNSPAHRGTRSLQSSGPTVIASTPAASDTVVATGTPQTVYALPNAQSRKVGSVSDGSNVEILCQSIGPTVISASGDPYDLWDRIRAPAGFMPDVRVGMGGMVSSWDCETGHPFYNMESDATVYIRPSLAAKSVARVRQGALVVIKCTASGPSVKAVSGNHTSIWDRITTPDGWVSDGYVNTSSTFSVEPKC
jgi:hypothetical protein